MKFQCFSPTPSRSAFYCVVAVAIVLSACSGGGGGSTAPATAAPTIAAGTTNASGTVVDDGSGSPLSGVPVKVLPWGPCGPTPSPQSITPEDDGCPTPLPQPQTSSDTNGHFTLTGVPNGHYLLVVGTDAVVTPPAGYTFCPDCLTTPAPFAIQATVHSEITLAGGAQALHAPTLPSVYFNTPKPWETNGDYRLATLDPLNESPCYLAWQYERKTFDVAMGAMDEWLLERVRAANYNNIVSGDPDVGGLPGTGGLFFAGSPKTTCASGFTSDFPAPPNLPTPLAVDPRTIWFAGQYNVNHAPGQGAPNGTDPVGLTSYLIDPRSGGAPWY